MIRLALLSALFYLSLISLKAQTMDSYQEPLPLAKISLALAGLPNDTIAAGDRLFFTVEEDVLCDGHLYIAAGARAAGTVMMLEREDCGLYLVVFPQSVQTVSGDIQHFDPDIAHLHVEYEQPYNTFTVPLPAHIRPDIPLYSEQSR